MTVPVTTSVSVQCFETYYMKTSISYRGSIVWNLLEPSPVSASNYAKRAKKPPALRNLNVNEESLQIGPQIDSDSSVIDNSIHIFYCT